MSKGFLRDAILGDLVGLGKMWITIGFILKNKNLLHGQFMSKNIYHGKPLPEAKPTLVVVPPNLIFQWASELARVLKKFNVHSNIYYGDAQARTPERLFKSKLTYSKLIKKGQDFATQSCASTYSCDYIISSYR
jgi:SNF2 family DNA or RNA helicase